MFHATSTYDILHANFEKRLRYRSFAQCFLSIMDMYSNVFYFCTVFSRKLIFTPQVV